MPLTEVRSDFDLFKDHLQAADTVVHRDVMLLGEAPATVSPYSFGPTPELAAISAVADLTRTRPRQPLVSELIPDTDFGGFALKTLVRMLNATHSPEYATEAIPRYHDRSQLMVSACSAAEAWFARTAIMLEDDNMQPDAQIITFDGEPVILRKGRVWQKSHSSGLTLVPFSDNGVPVPAGSIVRVDTTYDISHHGKMHDGDDILPGVTRVDYDEVTAVVMNRLSLYGIPLTERTPGMIDEFTQPASITPVQPNQARRYLSLATVDTFREIAETALAHAA